MTDIILEMREAERLQSKGQFSRALSIYERIDKALKINSFDDEWLYYLRLNEGHCARLAGDFKKAINYYLSALKIARKIGVDATADAHAGLGTAFRAIGKFDDALENFERALRIYQSACDLEGQGYIFWAKGGMLRFMGYLKDAFKMFKKALSIYEGLNDKVGVGYSLCGLGGVSRVMGNFELSLEYYTKANQVLNGIKDRFGTAYSYCGIANANRMLGNFENARKYFKYATRVYEEIGDKVSYAYTLWGEGTLAKVLLDFETAMDKFSKAEKIFKETGDKRGLIYTELGKIEIDFLLKGKVQIKRIDRIFKISETYGYNFEKLHIVLVERLIHGKDTEYLYDEYEKFGSRFLRRIEIGFPLNLP